MIRVSRGRVRVYPLIDQAGRPVTGLLEQLIEQLTYDGVASTLVDVYYEFQRGAQTMLELRSTGAARTGTDAKRHVDAIPQ